MTGKVIFKILSIVIAKQKRPQKNKLKKSQNLASQTPAGK